MDGPLRRVVNTIEFWHPAGGPIVSTLEQAHAHLADKQQGRIPPVRSQAAMLLHFAVCTALATSPQQDHHDRCASQHPTAGRLQS